MERLEAGGSVINKRAASSQNIGQSTRERFLGTPSRLCAHTDFGVSNPVGERHFGVFRAPQILVRMH